MLVTTILMILFVAIRISVFSASILSQKVGWAVGIAFAGILLGTVGFKPNVAQNPEVLQAQRPR